MTDYTNPTRATESDEDTDETINYKSIEFNQCLIEGIESFERREFTKALEKYNSALNFIKESDVERRALLNRYRLEPQMIL